MKRTHKTHKRAHLVGIKGVAMASLAVYLRECKISVTGSDVPDDFPTADALAAAGIRVAAGFDPTRVQGHHRPDVVYYTGAHGGRDNPEVVAAIAEGIPVFPHGQALGEIMAESRQIVVSGSHGKTTVSAMIAAVLTAARYHPSYAIGAGSIPGLGAAGHRGSGAWFVAEGDEYVTDPMHDPTPRFLWLHPEILVVTNIDFDHPDAYVDLPAVQEAFFALKNQSKTVIVNADDPNSAMLRGSDVITYGFSPGAQYRITRVNEGDGRMFFTLEDQGMGIGEFALKVPGHHNVSNATAAMIASRLAGVGWDDLRKGLLTFTGTKRRFELLATVDGVTVYDDYAHHPAEIAATLRATRAWFLKRRIIAVFQPHTYSRTKTLLSEFAKSFKGADVVILTDIYASAREHDSMGIDGMTLVRETAKRHHDVRYAKDKAAVIEVLGKEARPGDVILCMGAGDIYNWEREIVQSMSDRLGKVPKRPRALRRKMYES